MRSTLPALVLAVLATVLVAGCSSTPNTEPNPTAAVPVTTAAPVTPEATATPTPESTTTSAAPVTQSPASSPSHVGEPAAGAGFKGVQLTRSGGIAGITETTTVNPDGTWTVRSSQGGDRSGKLSAADKAKLNKLAADPKLAKEAGGKSGSAERCADAFSYLLVAGGRFVRYTSCGQADKPEVTLAIITLLQSATKGQ
jgi:hypothetical protein